uniref:ATP synthase F0 subunit 8 n=2 Tax=Gelidium TaxID=2811 RepID=A0A1D8X7V9_9FLOR|nr:ATP synthase F0 subunit 8 [Gelidium sinicola]YP_009559277.1 ATP synthase F0 subunit 8 [Gelidium coulteri]AOX49025.1 ATP synthase F0 subunit 8 [Gelidium sinicola]QBA96124.1 ATP synthase F0 subunit 8 [Gelidium coulteri]
MPQLDYIIIFPQIFWLFLIFTVFYISLTHFFLPKFLKSLKARKEIIKANEAEALSLIKKSTDNQTKLNLLLSNYLSDIKRIFSVSPTLSISDTKSLNNKKADELISIMIKNSALFCDSQILDSISINVKSVYSK